MSDLGRILIADDEETFLHSTADLLRREGYECDCAPDADAAAVKLKEKEYDLLIADIKMPRMDGITFLKRLMSFRPLPVIMISSYTRENSRRTLEALDAGAVDFDEDIVDAQSRLRHVLQPQSLFRFALDQCFHNRGPFADCFSGEGPRCFQMIPSAVSASPRPISLSAFFHVILAWASGDMWPSSRTWVSHSMCWKSWVTSV